MVSWLTCLIRGILELQKLGIIHADLEFRNTIRVKGEDGWTYKIIDFDLSFMVKEGHSILNSMLFDNTKKMIRLWLSLDSS